MRPVSSSSIRATLRYLRRALAFAESQRRAVVAVIALAVLVSSMAVIDPLILRYVVDGLILDRRLALARLGAGAGALLGFYLLRESLFGLSTWLSWRTRLRIQQGVLDATMARLHALPVAYHQGEAIGSTMARLDRGIQGLVGAVSELAFNVVPALVFLALSAAAMARLEWRLLVVMAVLVPLPALVGVWAAPVQTARDRTLLDRWARLYARLNEVLSSIATVKSFAMEHEEKRRFMNGVGEANAVVVRGVSFDARVGAVQQSLVALARVAVIGYGGYLAIGGEISVGTLLAFLGYVMGLFSPIQGLTGIYQTLHRASVSLDVVFSIIDAEDHIRDRPGALPVTGIRGAVSFENVAFGYVEGRPVLHGVSFDVEPGQMVALVGPSGGGKTSLAALLQRLYDPHEGAIRIDGVDVRSMEGASLRRHIGTVMQDAVLFSESVRANIAYGRPDATTDEIEAAAIAANAHDFILTLPGGYDAELGAGGSRLSAGQRQRVAIARAILKRPSIVVLDEATSALDAESEALVHDALERLLVGRTTFVIAHRLATVVHADEILVVRDGRITERGTHGALLAADGYYASLIRLQTRGLLDPTADA
jgi:ATP-binding cassette subfamily B protein